MTMIIGGRHDMASAYLVRIVPGCRYRQEDNNCELANGKAECTINLGNDAHAQVCLSIKAEFGRTYLDVLSAQEGKESRETIELLIKGHTRDVSNLRNAVLERYGSEVEQSVFEQTKNRVRTRNAQ